MSLTTYTIPSTDDHAIFVREWSVPKNRQVKGAIHISHGMAEHSERYDRFAKALNAQGFVVFAHDHRGHGHAMSEQQGVFSRENGWQKVLADMDVVQKHIRNAHPDAPLFLFGHSMGSFIAMSFIKHYQPALNGFVASGSNWDEIVKYRALIPILKAEKMRLGADKPSPIVEMLTFGAFNAKFKPAQTDSDWLSRDPQEVQKYLNDSMCGFFCSTQLWEDLVTALIDISTKQAFMQFPNSLPLYIFSGDQDPVGNFGKGVRALAKHFITGGTLDLTLRLYPEGRHEMLNETNRDEVTSDMVNWLISRL